jgi:hypothetical protein
LSLECSAQVCQLRGFTNWRQVVFEQFRVLSAALRLDAFTASDLADASGVRLATVKKTLVRHKGLFLREKQAGSSRRGAQPFWYRLDREAAKAVVHRESQQLKFPDPPAGIDGKPLGLELAKKALLSVFPKALATEQQSVLRAAAAHLALASGAKDVDRELLGDLSRLQRSLLILVAIRDWLEVYPSSTSDYRRHHAEVKLILRVLFKADKVSVTNDILDAMLGFTVSLAYLFGGKHIAGLPYRPSQIYEAYWAIISNPLWEVTLDTCADPASLARAATRAQHSNAEVSMIPPMVTVVTDRVVSTELTKVDIYPFHFFHSASMRVGRERYIPTTNAAISGNYEELFSIKKPSAIVVLYCASVIHVRNHQRPTYSVGDIVAFEVDFANNIIGNATVRTPGNALGLGVFAFADIQYDLGLFGDQAFPTATALTKPRAKVDILMPPPHQQIEILTPLSWVEPETMRFSFPKGSRFDIRSTIVDSLTNYGAVFGPDHRIGELLDVEVNLKSGKITNGHVRMDGQPTAVAVPINSLEFIPEDRIFIYKSNSGPSKAYSAPTNLSLMPAPNLGYLRR